MGKSWLADTVPGPRLVLDAEGRAQHTPSGPKMWWDPTRYGPPEASDAWQTCVVNVHEFDVMQLVYNWLRTSPHPFTSLVIDSLMEVQKRLIDKTAGAEQLKTQDWGEVLRRLEKLVRDFRDLTLVPAQPLSVVAMVVGTKSVEGVMRPLLQGQMGNTAPYYLDVVGYHYAVPTADQLDVTRHLLTGTHPNFTAKDGTGKLPRIIDNPNIAQMVDLLYASGKAERQLEEVQA